MAPDPPRASTGGLPDATVVMLVHRPGRRELETAERVRAQRYPGAVSLLAIDSSPDPSLAPNRSLRDRADRWQAIAAAEFAHGETRNRAVDLVSTPLVAFLSQDAHPAGDGWLEALARPLAAGEAEASYGRQAPPRPDAERDATFGFLYPDRPEVKTLARLPELGIRTFHFSDVSSAFVTAVIRRVQFPTDIPVFEDVGVAKRLLEAGYSIAYVPEALVIHAHSMSLRDTVRRYRQIGAVYERLGIFAELRRNGPGMVTEGIRTARAVSPAPGRRRLTGTLRAAAVGGLKAAAVTWGRLEARAGVGSRQPLRRRHRSMASR